jgi:RNA recognition motif-containing protein
VGDLELSITEEFLKDYFSKYYSSVIGVKVIIDPVNKSSKGYGFVKFSDQNESLRALTEMNGRLINGKAIRTK